MCPHCYSFLLGWTVLVPLPQELHTREVDRLFKAILGPGQVTNFGSVSVASCVSWEEMCPTGPSPWSHMAFPLPSHSLREAVGSEGEKHALHCL